MGLASKRLILIVANQSLEVTQLADASSAPQLKRSAKMKRFLSIVLLNIPLIALPSEKEYLDYNFDGYPDYRIWRENNGRLGYYDIFLYSLSEKEYVKDHKLSSLYNPNPDKDEEEIECVWPGGHSGMIYSKEVYKWSGNELVLKYVEKQTNFSTSDGVHYIKVVSSILDGKPHIESIELVDKNLPKAEPVAGGDATR